MTVILIVDDEPALRKALRASLAGGDFEIAEAHNGEQAIIEVQRLAPALVLLDINMPGMSGFEVCRRLRLDFPSLGIIMVTVRDSEEDHVRALEAGADDYVTKPYRLRELIARLHAVRRRLSATPSASRSIQIGELTIDLDRRILTKSTEEIRLSPKEFDLMTYFFQNPGKPLLHQKILQNVWGPEYGGELEYLRSYVKMLRKKIETDPAQPRYIITEPWVGYRFSDQ